MVQNKAPFVRDFKVYKTLSSKKNRAVLICLSIKLMFSKCLRFFLAFVRYLYLVCNSSGRHFSTREGETTWTRLSERGRWYRFWGVHENVSTPSVFSFLSIFFFFFSYFRVFIFIFFFEKEINEREAWDRCVRRENISYFCFIFFVPGLAFLYIRIKLWHAAVMATFVKCNVSCSKPSLYCRKHPYEVALYKWLTGSASEACGAI